MSTVTLYFAGTVEKEGDWYVSRCSQLPIASQGRTEAEALANLIEATQLFLETCIAEGTLPAVITRYKWRPAHQIPGADASSDSFIAPLRVSPPVAHQLECFA
jgi:predicted RNase H-like HicB family nuclease